MKIISDFKDYYDYVSNIYGEDKKVVYNRTCKNNSLCFKHESNFKIKIHGFYYHLFPDFNFKWCVICDKIFLLYAYSTLSKHGQSEFKLISKSDEVFDIITKKVFYDLISISKLDNFFNSVFNFSHPNLLQLSREIKMPVFIINNIIDGFVYIENKIPKLYKLGFSEIISPEQMYQNIEYYLLNKIHDNPDITPPVIINNDDRIVSHGFDLKKSFRHVK